MNFRLKHCVQGKEKSDLDQQSVFFDWYEDTGNISPEFPVLDVFVDDFYLYPSKVITRIHKKLEYIKNLDIFDLNFSGTRMSQMNRKKSNEKYSPLKRKTLNKAQLNIFKLTTFPFQQLPLSNKISHQVRSKSFLLFITCTVYRNIFTVSCQCNSSLLRSSTLELELD